MRRHAIHLVPVALGVLLMPVLAVGDLVNYELTFDATWSPSTHPPSEFPPFAHFSPLVGLTHNAEIVPWKPGELASPGIKRIAETGATSTAFVEMNEAIAAGKGYKQFNFGGLGTVPRTKTGVFEASRSHPYVTFASMIAPSPDWFVGGSAIALLEDGQWIPEIRFAMTPWDAGTDSGANFTSANLATVPHVPISAIQGTPFDSGVPLGTFTLTLKTVPGDLDGDGGLGAGDIAHLCGQLGERNAAVDLTGDGQVELADLTVWVEQHKGTRAGDVNLDGEVRFDDFLGLAAGFAKPGGWAEGDFNCDGHVRFNDFLNLASNFGFPAEAPAGALGAAATSAAVPEASGWRLLAVGVIATTVLRRRGRRR